MPRIHRAPLVAGLLLALLPAPGLHAEDVPPPGPPTVDPAGSASLRRADELDRQVMALYRQQKFAEATVPARESVALREKALGADSPGLAESLMTLADLLKLQGEHTAARQVVARVLAIQEKALGADHPNVVATCNLLAVYLIELADYAEARSLLERALASQERRWGSDHIEVAQVLSNLAVVLSYQGAYKEAKPLYERALTIRERALGPEDPMVVDSLDNLAALLKLTGAYAEAAALYRRALGIREKTLPKDDPGTARILAHLASALEDQGAYAEARSLLERALAIQEKALGPDHPDVAATLGALGLVLSAMGAHAEVTPLLERALSIRERAFGAAHPLVATTLNDLASNAQDLGDYERAGPLYERAIATSERALGKDHPDVATSLHNLASLLSVQGVNAKARHLAERALAIREKALGPSHPYVASTLGVLARILSAQGADAEAMPLFERTLVVCEAAYGPDHPLVAVAAANAAVGYESLGEYEKAKRLYERAVAISEKTLGEDHPQVAETTASLARVLRIQGATEEAKRLYRRALALEERVLGPDHPDVAWTLDALAGLLRAEGALGEAKALTQRALAIDERALGPRHPDVAGDLAKLAMILQSEGAYDQARPLYERALSITEGHVRGGLSALSSSQRLAFVRSVRAFLDTWVRFAPLVGRSGHDEALRFRGLVARAEAAERALARAAVGEQRQRLEELQAVTRRAARLANEMPATRDPAARAAWQERYAAAAAERERLSRELASALEAGRAAAERLDLSVADVQAAMPADAVLVDVLRVGARYVAWVLRRTGAAVRVDLGRAEPIDAACEAFVAAIAGDEGDDASRQAVASAGADVRRLVWEPLEPRLGADVRRVLLCPDAALASVPIAALPGKEPGRALLDDLAISYVFHPFDLVPRRGGAPSGSGALVAGGIDYERAETGSKERPLPERPPVLAALDRAPRSGAFVPIPATRTEAEGLRDRFGAGATTLLIGADATEARLREGVRGKRFLHVATHGFARDDLLAGLYDRRVEDAFLSEDAERQLAVGHDPMLLAGLAFAGANPRDGAGGDDGILTALEASYLDLDGVDLVTLSACETARGTAQSGEGVLGLVSGFQMAGAHDVIASLWKVDDEATQLLMDGVYERILRRQDPMSPADALRASALALRDRTDAARKRRYASPRYWAAFVAYGG